MGIFKKKGIANRQSKGCGGEIMPRKGGAEYRLKNRDRKKIGALVPPASDGE